MCQECTVTTGDLHCVHWLQDAEERKLKKIKTKAEVEEKKIQRLKAKAEREKEEQARLKKLQDKAEREARESEVATTTSTRRLHAFVYMAGGQDQAAEKATTAS